MFGLEVKDEEEEGDFFVVVGELVGLDDAGDDGIVGELIDDLLVPLKDDLDDAVDLGPGFYFNLLVVLEQVEQ